MEIIDMQSADVSADNAIRSLESGNILFFPRTPFEIPQSHRDALLNAGQADGNFHKNISYKPATGRIAGVGKTTPGEERQIQEALRHYSLSAVALLERVLAPYRALWKMDYASFRSIEEEGRDLPWKKRNDLLHTDAFPTRPTNGGLILRIFTNINPVKDRVWVTSDPFAQLARQHAVAAGIPAPTPPLTLSLQKALRALGLPVVPRSAYDRFMLSFHDYLKANNTYQQECPKYRFSFPPGSTWMVFTDVVPHSVLSGRFALEQTMIIASQSLLQPVCAPAAILENLTGYSLTDAELK